MTTEDIPDVPTEALLEKAAYSRDRLPQCGRELAEFQRADLDGIPGAKLRGKAKQMEQAADSYQRILALFVARNYEADDAVTGAMYEWSEMEEDFKNLALDKDSLREGQVLAREVGKLLGVVAFTTYDGQVCDRLRSKVEDYLDKTRTRRLHSDLEALAERLENEVKQVALAHVADKVYKLGVAVEKQADSLHRSANLKTTHAKMTYANLLTNYGNLSASLDEIDVPERLQSLLDRLDPLLEIIRDRMDDSETVVEAKPHIDGGGKTERRNNLKTKLPEFEGDILQWSEFWQLFDTLIEKEGLSDAEKISHLQGAMKSTESKSIAKQASVKSKYSDVVAALKKQYDVKRVVYSHLVQTLQKREPVGHNLVDVTRSKQEFITLVQGLRTCEAETVTKYLVATTVALMDPSIKRNWSQHTKNMKEIPDEGTLIEFYEAECVAMQAGDLEEVPRVKQPTSRQKTPPFKPKSAWLPKATGKPKLPVYRIGGPEGVYKCTVCSGDHSVYGCEKLRKADVNTRQTLVREQSLCTNCLQPRHVSRDCKSKGTCRECGGRHHTLLHKATPSTVPVRRLTVDGRSGKYCPTAMARVSIGSRAHSARIMMDTGSEANLISTKLARQLNATRRRFDGEIKGIGGVEPVKDMVDVTLSSLYDDNDDEVTITALVRDQVAISPRARLGTVTKEPFLEGLPLADPSLENPGKVDLLISSGSTSYFLKGKMRHSDGNHHTALLTIFGWVVLGNTPNGESPTPTCRQLTATQDSIADDLLKYFWEVDRMPGEPANLTSDQEAAVLHFDEHVTRDEDGRYRVTLPPRLPTPVLGKSRSTALGRYKSVQKKLASQGKWGDFAEAVQSYPEMGHAEKVPEDELDEDAYYLPLQAVFKESSETTKLRVVFDASAKTSTGVSLNDSLLAGPSLYPRLTSILNRFRVHKIGMAADIGKMFREIGLHREDYDKHRFLVPGPGGQPEDYRMTRVTFGVKSSPFLATSVLHKLAMEYREKYPLASKAIMANFYVDDMLSGASDVEEAVKLREEVSCLCSEGQMTIRKWLSSSADFMDTIPEDLKANDVSSLSIAPVDCSKTLGIHWNTATDMLYVSTPELTEDETPTKRQIVSAAAKTYDVQGWFTPALVVAKIIIQDLWKIKLGWDDLVPPETLKLWKEWKSQLHLISKFPINRWLVDHDSPVTSRELHGFSDASIKAYAGVVYLKTSHENGEVSIRLITAAARVAPLSGRTIPRMELCGAHLLSGLLKRMVDDLEVPKTAVYAWTDSSIVLSWLSKPPTSLMVYVANRVTEICEHFPACHWRHVPTLENPADLPSRGLLPTTLLSASIWWHGPEWLSKQADEWPERKDLNPISDLPEIRPAVRILSTTTELKLWRQSNEYDRVLKSLAWIRRYFDNLRTTDDTQRMRAHRLTNEEIAAARLHMTHLSQRSSFPATLTRLQAGKELTASDSLQSLHPLMDPQGVMRVGGRLEHSELSFDAKHPIILDRKSWLVRLLVHQCHLRHNHAGPSTMMAILAETYHIQGGQKYIRSYCRGCVTCRKT